MTQLRQRVERIEHAETSSVQFGAEARDLANFPGMVNLVAGANITLTPAAGTLTIAGTGGGGGSGTVTSVSGSGGSTGLTLTGGPITTSGTLTLGGTLAIASGGTSATTAPAALTALGAYPATNPAGYTNNTGTVTSVGVSTGSSGVSVTGSPVTTSGTIDLDLGTLANVDDAPADGSTYGRKNNAWVATGGGFEPSTAWDIYEEFIWSGANDGGRWQVGASGPGNTAFRSEHRHPGIRVLRSTGVGGYSAATNNKLFVGGATAQTHEFVFRIPVLGSATQRFSTTIGLAEDYVSGTGENLRLLYIDSINSGAFTLRATVGGVQTDYLSTSVFAAAGTWYHGKIVLDGTGQAFAYVNGVLIATATSVPSAAMYASATFYKTVATGADPGTELELDMFHSFGSR